ncbi:polysaccharide pyruvyl transferase family protein [Stieleria sp. ICT_E10.1]|uniref:polysaccharide pyruvyl transferase family protein n=1 Tax=Stieleria sedimenti TaxID=2976331 RepID=UPI00217F7F3D|nr:polysaccharide pyruvyl transferase family protein [Stieleria sedimenti]MCS7465776.1 polysaccharide pyruvyl transferase family protein [Stieleria sedimenti]
MKVGLLTFHFSNNYGALLQAYALRTWLSGEGVDAEFINYHPRYVEEGKFAIELSANGIRTNLKSLFLQYSKLRSHLFHRNALAALEEFRATQLGIGGPTWRSRAELESAELEYDLLVCGSDQIWNPSPQFGLDPVYFLDFVAKSKRRISYAASFGSNELSPAFHADLSGYLGRLDAISIRERGGAKFAESLIGSPVPCLPDPTFLISDYSALIDDNTIVASRAIFSYVLRSGAGFSRLADELKKTLNAKVISGYNPLRRWREIGIPVSGGPIAWLSNLYASKLVLTNSFHATVFSILFRRSFIAVKLPGARSKLSVRLENLLRSVGLEERLIDANDIESANRLAKESIDWSSANHAIARLRAEGRSFLLENISACRFSDGSFVRA